MLILLMLGFITYKFRDRFSLAVPLAITRSWLYIFSLGVALLMVLLPLANLSYMKFYNSLIPQGSPRIPLNPTITRSFEDPGSTILDLSQFWSDHPYKFDKLLHYEWNLHLDIFCDVQKNGAVFKIPYKIVNVLNGAERDLLVSSFILDCDSRYIHHSNNRLVPFNLRFWVPPAIVDINRSIKFNLRKLILKGGALTGDIRKIKVIFEGANFFKTNDDDTYLQFQVKFTGFRYYLVEHFYFCYVLGVAMLWFISSFVCVLMSSYILFSEEESEQYIKLEKE